MIVCTYSVHDQDPIVRVQTTARRRWLIKFYITDGKERITETMRNRQPAFLTEMLDAAKERIDDMMQDMPVFEDAGFQVQLLR